MKNLKKVLSLVLALAMALSLMTVAFADVTKASSMTGYDKTQYTEAMDVMVALGVIDGVSGDLAPTQNVTREQAAKIIAVLLEGTDVKDMYTTGKYFSDVASTRWSAPYIAYCVEKGIVSGVGGGKFNPAGNVTGYQFAKMLLVALGYDASIENYTGTNWAVNVASDANSAKLFKDVKNANKTIAATREEVAQYCLNELKATMVTYDNTGTNITIGNTNVNVAASKATKVASDDTSINTKINKGDKFTDVNGVNGYTLEFGEKYFSADSDVKLAKAADTDRLARPAHTWSIKAGDIGTYADSADQTYVVAKNGKDVKTILTGSDYINYKDTDVLSSAVVYLNAVNKGTYNTLSATSTLLGAGDVVETFTNDDDKVDTIVVTRYTAAKIDDIDNGLSSTYTKKDAAYGITLKAIEGSAIPSNTLYDAYTGDTAKVLEGFDAKTYTEGTVLAIALKGDEVLASYVATAATDSSINSYNSTAIYIGGTKYSYAAEAAGISAASLGTAGSSVSYDSSSKYDVYKDANDYVIAVTGVKASIKDVYYVTGTYGNSSTYGGTSYYAQAVNITTGEVKEMQLENKLADSSYISGTQLPVVASSSWSATEKGLYVFTDKEVYTAASRGGDKMSADNGKYNAVKYVSNTDYAIQGPYTLTTDVKADSTNIKSTGLTTKYITSATNFVAVEKDQGDIAASSATGSMKMAAASTTSVYVINSTTSADANKAAYVVFVGTDLGGAVGSDSIVYVDDTQTFTTNTAKSTTNANVYFMNDNSAKDVVVDGTASLSGFYKYSTDKDDIYTLKTGTAIASEVKSDTDGFYAGLAISSYDSDINVLSGSTYFDAVKYGNAKVIDVRSSGDKDNDLFEGDITSVSALNNALKKGTTGVSLDVYVNDGAITFIAVQSATDKAAATTYTMTAAANTKVSLDNKTYAATVAATKGQTVYVKADAVNTALSFTTPAATAVTTVTAPAAAANAVYSFAAPDADTTIACTTKVPTTFDATTPAFTATGSKLAMTQMTVSNLQGTVKDGTLALTVYSVNTVTGKYDVSEKTMNVTITNGVAAATDIMTSLTTDATYQIAYTITIDGVTTNGQSGTLKIAA